MFAFGTDLVEWSGVALPAALDGAGLPGCDLWLARARGAVPAARLRRVIRCETVVHQGSLDCMLELHHVLAAAGVVSFVVPLAGGERGPSAWLMVARLDRPAALDAIASHEYARAGDRARARAARRAADLDAAATGCPVCGAHLPAARAERCPDCGQWLA